MEAYFDLEKLRSFLKDFYTLTHIRITVFSSNFEELAAYPKDQAFFCRLLRKNTGGLKQCRLCDKRACEAASKRSDTYIYRCHAGLTEAITPIYFRDEAVGYLFFGQVFSYDSQEQGIRQILTLCRQYDIPQEQLADALLTMPLLTKDYILSASHLLRAAASFLYFDQMVLLSDLPKQIDDFIMSHLAESLTAEVLCRELGVGKTTLWKLSTRHFGCGIADHIRQLRLTEAKRRLREYPDQSIDAVAAYCGFSDYNYFITAFRKAVGVPPLAYRKTHCNRK